MSIEPTEVEYEAMLCGMARQWKSLAQDQVQASVETLCRHLLLAAIGAVADEDMLANAREIIRNRARRNRRSVAKYRKRPVEIDAIQWTGGPTIAALVLNWITTQGGVARYDDEADVIFVETMEGAMMAREGWWVIRGVRGEFYPCEPGIFAETYEAVTT